MNKNDTCMIEITDQDDLGHGIGKVNGFPIFVPQAVTGDVLEIGITKVKKNFGFGRILRFEKPSESRIDPSCPVFKRCGGCQLQMMTYEAQLAFKQRRVEECLRRIGGCSEIPMVPILGTSKTLRYRNKAQFPVGTDKDGRPICGFYAERSHAIIPAEDCQLLPEEFNAIAAQVLVWMEENRIRGYEETTGRGLIRHIFIRKGFATGETALCLIINGKKLPHFEELKNRLEPFRLTSISISENTTRNNVIMGKQPTVLEGQAYITDKIGGISYRISPMSFYQVNPEQTKKLYDAAIDFADLTGEETVLDLYCGAGTISLYLAQKAKTVCGIEIIEQAVRDAEENMRLNGITNAEFHAGKAEEVLPQLYRAGLPKIDVVVVDPPRKGCDEVCLSTICEIAPERLVYVSCNPATLARDVKFLQERGFQLEKVQPVDMFPNTAHVETVVLMSRVSNEPCKDGENQAL